MAHLTLFVLWSVVLVFCLTKYSLSFTKRSLNDVYDENVDVMITNRLKSGSLAKSTSSHAAETKLETVSTEGTDREKAKLVNSADKQMFHETSKEMNCNLRECLPEDDHPGLSNEAHSLARQIRTFWRQLTQKRQFNLMSFAGLTAASWYTIKSSSDTLIPSMIEMTAKAVGDEIHCSLKLDNPITFVLTDLEETTAKVSRINSTCLDLTFCVKPIEKAVVALLLNGIVEFDNELGLLKFQGAKEQLQFAAANTFIFKVIDYYFLPSYQSDPAFHSPNTPYVVLRDNGGGVFDIYVKGTYHKVKFIGRITSVGFQLIEDAEPTLASNNENVEMVANVIRTASFVEFDSSNHNIRAAITSLELLTRVALVSESPRNYSTWSLDLEQLDKDDSATVIPFFVDREDKAFNLYFTAGNTKRFRLNSENRSSLQIIRPNLEENYPSISDAKVSATERTVVNFLNEVGEIGFDENRMYLNGKGGKTVNLHRASNFMDVLINPQTDKVVWRLVKRPTIWSIKPETSSTHDYTKDAIATGIVSLKRSKLFVIFKLNGIVCVILTPVNNTTYHQSIPHWASQSKQLKESMLQIYNVLNDIDSITAENSHSMRFNPRSLPPLTLRQNRNQTLSRDYTGMNQIDGIYTPIIDGKDRQHETYPNLLLIRDDDIVYLTFKGVEAELQIKPKENRMVVVSALSRITFHKPINRLTKMEKEFASLLNLLYRIELNGSDLTFEFIKAAEPSTASKADSVARIQEQPSQSDSLISFEEPRPFPFKALSHLSPRRLALPFSNASMTDFRSKQAPANISLIPRGSLYISLDALSTLVPSNSAPASISISSATPSISSAPLTISSRLNPVETFSFTTSSLALNSPVADVSSMTITPTSDIASLIFTPATLSVKSEQTFVDVLLNTEPVSIDIPSTTLSISSSPNPAELLIFDASYLPLESELANPITATSVPTPAVTSLIITPTTSPHSEIIVTKTTSITFPVSSTPAASTHVIPTSILTALKLKPKNISSDSFASPFGSAQARATVDPDFGVSDTQVVEGTSPTLQYGHNTPTAATKGLGMINMKTQQPLTPKPTTRLAGRTNGSLESQYSRTKSFSTVSCASTLELVLGSYRQYKNSLDFYGSSQRVVVSMTYKTSARRTSVEIKACGSINFLLETFGYPLAYSIQSSPGPQHCASIDKKLLSIITTMISAEVSQKFVTFTNSDGHEVSFGATMRLALNDCNFNNPLRSIILPDILPNSLTLQLVSSDGSNLEMYLATLTLYNTYTFDLLINTHMGTAKASNVRATTFSRFELPSVFPSPSAVWSGIEEIESSVFSIFSNINSACLTENECSLQLEGGQGSLNFIREKSHIVNPWIAVVPEFVHSLQKEVYLSLYVLPATSTTLDLKGILTVYNTFAFTISPVVNFMGIQDFHKISDMKLSLMEKTVETLFTQRFLTVSLVSAGSHGNDLIFWSILMSIRFSQPSSRRAISLHGSNWNFLSLKRDDESVLKSNIPLTLKVPGIPAKVSENSNTETEFILKGSHEYKIPVANVTAAEGLPDLGLQALEISTGPVLALRGASVEMPEVEMVVADTLRQAFLATFSNNKLTFVSDRAKAIFSYPENQ